MVTNHVTRFRFY